MPALVHSYLDAEEEDGPASLPRLARSLGPAASAKGIFRTFLPGHKAYPVRYSDTIRTAAYPRHGVLVYHTLLGTEGWVGHEA